MSARKTQRKPLKRLKTGSGFPAWRVAPPLRPIRGSDAPGPRSEEVAKVTGLGAYPTENDPSPPNDVPIRSGRSSSLPHRLVAVNADCADLAE